MKQFDGLWKKKAGLRKKEPEKRATQSKYIQVL